MTDTLLELRDRDPYAYYEELRVRAPVVWDEGMQAWLVLGHAECVVVERREDWFAPGMGSLPRREGDHGRPQHPDDARQAARRAAQAALEVADPGALPALRRHADPAGGHAGGRARRPPGAASSTTTSRS